MASVQIRIHFEIKESQKATNNNPPSFPDDWNTLKANAWAEIGSRVPEAMRNAWLGLTHGTASDGSIPEADIRTELQNQLDQLPQPMTVSPDPVEVVYVFYDNTRKCIHTYGVTTSAGEVAGFDAPSPQFDGDKVDVDGQGKMRIPLRVEFSWDHSL